MSDEHSNAAWPKGAPLEMAERRQAFGQKLRATREQKQISIIALAQSTRISSNFIEALESGQFERLPGEVFGRGFLRNLSRALSLTPEATEELLTEYNACGCDDEAPVTRKPKVKPAPAKSAAQAAAAISQKLGPQVSATVDPKRRRNALNLRYGAGSTIPSRWLWGAAATLIAVLAVAGFRYFRAGKFGSWSSLKVPQPAAVVEPITAQKPEPPPLEVDQFEGNDEAETAAQPQVNPVAVEPLQPATGKAELPKTEAETAPVPVAVKPVQTMISAPPGATGDVQTLEFIVTEPVKIRIGLDQQAAVVKEFKPDTYKFTFTKTAELLVFDAAAVKINYNGKSLGSLGSKGRVRRISFDAVPPTDEKF